MIIQQRMIDIKVFILVTRRFAALIEGCQLVLTGMTSKTYWGRSVSILAEEPHRAFTDCALCFLESALYTHQWSDNRPRQVEYCRDFVD